MPENRQFSRPTRYQNAAINYYLGLTDSPFLHYGYWEPLPQSPEDLTIERLRKAQADYAAKLLALIPAETKTILDVGCGIGGNAAYLLDKGFQVEGLAPDAFQGERFRETTRGRAPFHLTGFETFASAHTYDLILLSESSQYIAAPDIAQGAARLLAPGGYLLLADMMRRDADYTEGIFSNCRLATELATALAGAGFNRLEQEDISAQIAPTLDLCVVNFRRFGLSTLRYGGELLAIAAPPLHWLLRKLYDRYLGALVQEGLGAREIFERHLCYEIQLWQWEPEN
ncbi:MAG: methyltransferase domain-containing protein [Cyanobacteria bacterium RI_101]|nr:methyltransferase domain-containing protein [Cyanobacteria bacterium RI_101]